MLYSDPGKRHQHSRGFRGRLVELQYAEWLESQNHSILGMEAIRQGFDIEARSPDGVTTSYEVNFVGLEHRDF
jgi:TPP-dependent pyruvate/acetoin dehydrogenase alpha subunit